MFDGDCHMYLAARRLLLVVVAVQVSSSVCIACTSGRMKSGKKPVLWYMGVGGSVSMARLLTLVSLHYITFPTGNLFKSSKASLRFCDAMDTHLLHGCCR